MGPSENLRRTAGYRDRELNETHPFFLTKREGLKGTEATTPRTTIGSPFSKHVLLSPALMGVLTQGGDIPRYGVLSPNLLGIFSSETRLSRSRALLVKYRADRNGSRSRSVMPGSSES